MVTNPDKFLEFIISEYLKDPPEKKSSDLDMNDYFHKYEIRNAAGVTLVSGNSMPVNCIINTSDFSIHYNNSKDTVRSLYTLIDVLRKTSPMQVFPPDDLLNNENLYSKELYDKLFDEVVYVLADIDISVASFFKGLIKVMDYRAPTFYVTFDQTIMDYVMHYNPMYIVEFLYRRTAMMQSPNVKDLKKDLSYVCYHEVSHIFRDYFSIFDEIPNLDKYLPNVLADQIINQTLNQKFYKDDVNYYMESFGIGIQHYSQFQVKLKTSKSSQLMKDFIAFLNSYTEFTLVDELPLEIPAGDYDFYLYLGMEIAPNMNTNLLIKKFNKLMEFYADSQVENKQDDVDGLPQQCSRQSQSPQQSQPDMGQSNLSQQGTGQQSPGQGGQQNSDQQSNQGGQGSEQGSGQGSGQQSGKEQDSGEGEQGSKQNKKQQSNQGERGSEQQSQQDEQGKEQQPNQGEQSSVQGKEGFGQEKVDAKTYKKIKEQASKTPEPSDEDIPQVQKDLMKKAVEKAFENTLNRGKANLPSLADKNNADSTALEGMGISKTDVEKIYSKFNISLIDKDWRVLIKKAIKKMDVEQKYDSERPSKRVEGQFGRMREEEVPGNIFIVVDVSPSMTPDSFKKVVNFLISLKRDSSLKRILSKTKATFIPFGDKAVVKPTELPFNEFDFNAFKKIFIRQSNGSDLNPAIKFMFHNYTPKEIDLLLILSDFQLEPVDKITEVFLNKLIRRIALVSLTDLSEIICFSPEFMKKVKGGVI